MKETHEIVNEFFGYLDKIFEDYRTPKKGEVKTDDNEQREAE